MRPFLFFLSLFLTVSVQSQRVIDVNKNDVDPTRGFFYVVGGEPFSIAKYVKVVAGSPYFSEDWMRGSVISSSGQRYDSLQLKLDLLANELHFLDKEGRELITSNPLSEVLLTDSVSGVQSRFVHSSAIAVSVAPDEGWYQLLASGTVTLFVRLHKEISETMPYGSATAEQTIKTSPRYFISFNNVFARIKKINDLADLLNGKSTDVRTYISNNRLSGKSSNDYIRVVSYYNSLHPK